MNFYRSKFELKRKKSVLKNGTNGGVAGADIIPAPEMFYCKTIVFVRAIFLSSDTRIRYVPDRISFRSIGKIR